MKVKAKARSSNLTLNANVQTHYGLNRTVV